MLSVPLDADYIAPGLACVKPMRAKPVPLPDDHQHKIKAARKQRHAIRLEDQMDVSDDTNEASAATISLTDCLACSGCITSAETVLVGQQSAATFLHGLRQPTVQLALVTVAPAARAALAADAQLETLDAFQRLTGLLKSLGCHHVVDSGLSAKLWLTEMAAEFCGRFRASTNLPVLSSSCPGWVCYAEKVQGALVVERLSRVKSPQQIAGTLAKYHYAARLGVPPERVYHAAVMPCYDKKLEASRDDFVDEATGVRDVDVVLAASEVEELAREHHVGSGGGGGGSLRSLAPVTALDTELPLSTPGVASTSASGGAADFVFREAAAELYGVTLPAGPLPWVRGRNADVAELTLTVGDQVVLRFVRAYGFRNIQNVVRRLKGGRCNYHFVELMACPSGCANGGGLPKPPPLEGSARSEQIEERVRQGELGAVHPWKCAALRELYAEGGFLQGGPCSEAARRWLHTDFRALESDAVGGDNKKGLLESW